MSHKAQESIKKHVFPNKHLRDLYLVSIRIKRLNNKEISYIN